MDLSIDVKFASLCQWLIPFYLLSTWNVLSLSNLRVKVEDEMKCLKVYWLLNRLKIVLLQQMKIQRYNLKEEFNYKETFLLMHLRCLRYKTASILHHFLSRCREKKYLYKRQNNNLSRHKNYKSMVDEK